MSRCVGALERDPVEPQRETLSKAVTPRARPTWPSGSGGVAGRVPAVGAERDCA